MKTTIKVERVVNITCLQVSAEVRYWEDATVNGVEDETGDLIPFKYGDLWRPIINVDMGRVLNWPVGTTADIHYKVCDAGSYTLLDDNNEVVAEIKNDYVPSCLCPNENGYGDYIIMNIDETGRIEHWTFSADHVKDFEKE